MKSSVTFVIDTHIKKHISVFIILPACLRKDTLCCIIIVIINKSVVSGVVRWVYVNHLHPAEIRFLEQFQHFKIIALNVEVLRAVEVYALLTAGAQRCGNGSIRRKDSFLLVRPCELIAFFPAVNYTGVNLLHEYVLVNSTDYFAGYGVDGFSYCVREQLCKGCVVLVGKVRGVHFQLIH